MKKKFHELKELNSKLSNKLADSEGINLVQKAKYEATRGRFTEQVNKTDIDFENMDKKLIEIINITDKLNQAKSGSAEEIALKSQLEELNLQLNTLRFKLNDRFTSLKKNTTELEETFSKEQTDTEQTVTDDDIITPSKSFIGSEFLPSFENLNGIGQFAFSLIMLNYVVLSSLTTLAFIFYGNYLISRFNLEIKYPRLAKIIQLRRKFQNYYFAIALLTIAVISICEILASIFILTL
jgi:uncharacterized phage infection (PIP) family protein YhgE